MSNPLIKINFQSKKEFNLKKSLKKFSPIRKFTPDSTGLKQFSPIRNIKTDINPRYLSKQNTKHLEGNSPITPGTLPNSSIKSFSEYDLDGQMVILNELTKLNTRIGELDLKMNKNMRLLENELKRNKELKQKFKIMEKEFLNKKKKLNIRENPGCINSCSLW